MLVPYVTITNIVLYESDEKFADIWLFNQNTLNKHWLFGSWRDNLWKCAIVMAKRGVCKVTGMDFHCRENENIFDHWGRQNHQFYHFLTIWAYKWPNWVAWDPVFEGIFFQFVQFFCNILCAKCSLTFLWSTPCSLLIDTQILFNYAAYLKFHDIWLLANVFCI